MSKLVPVCTGSSCLMAFKNAFNLLKADELNMKPIKKWSARSIIHLFRLSSSICKH